MKAFNVKALAIVALALSTGSVQAACAGGSCGGVRDSGIQGRYNSSQGYYNDAQGYYNEPQQGYYGDAPAGHFRGDGHNHSIGVQGGYIDSDHHQSGFQGQRRSEYPRRNNRAAVQNRYGIHNEYTSQRLAQEGQFTEAMLMNQLDRQGRRTFYSMDEQGRQRALELANSGRFRDKNDAVQAAVEEMDSQNREASAQRLNNGMNR